MSHSTTFFKAPRYLFRKHNILNLISNRTDIKTFLDVGCGAGELACTLAEMGKKGVAVDFSESAIAIATSMRKSRSIKQSDLTFKLGGLENVAGKKFDLVTCFEVLEHVKNDKKLLHEIVKQSKKYVLISVPAKQRLFDASDEAVGHFRRYEKEELLKMLDGANLGVITFINYGYPFTNAVRISRKSAFIIKLIRNKKTSMKNRSKDSGINPIKLPTALTKLDIERVIIPFYHMSRPFNRFDLSEGYLVLCEKRP
ncbi:MAG: methyltransferase domain-containing protein [Candidatus Nomurabacteria bacterium]|nr:MAG: methyltransferase domain-containing protein [Candidatus Nomurabacteria bacterium]